VSFHPQVPEKSGLVGFIEKLFYFFAAPVSVPFAARFADAMRSSFRLSFGSGVFNLRRMIRRVLLLLSVCSLFAGQTEYLFLVTGDGIRHQEVFGGVDPQLMQEGAKQWSGIENVPALRDKFWAETPKERREKLMPFFWKTLVKEGVIYGNIELGSRVRCRNKHWFSYPGYAEILNGQAVPQIVSNDSIFSPRETVLEYLKRELKLKPEEVAAFGSWSVFNYITMQKDGAIFCNAGFERIDPKMPSTPAMRIWSDVQFQTPSPWETVRFDAVTLNLALEYISIHQPRVVYLALGETDDWAHDRRYDRTVQSLAFFDEALQRLWTMIQSTEPYRGKSTVIVTTDHGRGRTAQDWTSHGDDVPGADETWLAVFGPDVPKAGELRNTPAYSLSNVASTMLTLVGLPPAKFNPKAGPAIAEVRAKVK
jgi:hypothetical protein